MTIARQVHEHIRKSKKINTIIFLDDFAGTGNQFMEFYNHWYGVENKIPSRVQCVFLPLIAFQDGINEIKKTIPNINCMSVEVLVKKHQFFSDESPPFISDGYSGNTLGSAKAFYENMIANKKFPKNLLYGFNGMGVVLAFEDAVPNCSLPILWCHTSKWKPLFRR